LANGRDNIAVVKRRGQVRGGGKKPWRQKGTGRARFGSSRNPIWRGGGIVFGPTGEENYSKKMTLKAKRTAIRQALTLASDDNKVKVVETFTTMEGKTKDMAKFLSKIEASGKILCVVSQKHKSKERATQNIPELKVVSAKYLTVFDILNANQIIFTGEALEIINEWLGA
jgi:large subunit ribosomal protein L4